MTLHGLFKEVYGWFLVSPKIHLRLRYWVWGEQTIGFVSLVAWPRLVLCWAWLLLCGSPALCSGLGLASRGWLSPWSFAPPQSKFTPLRLSSYLLEWLACYLLSKKKNQLSHLVHRFSGLSGFIFHSSFLCSPALLARTVCCWFCGVRRVPTLHNTRSSNRLDVWVV